jgi:hypothetical protein
MLKHKESYCCLYKLRSIDENKICGAMQWIVSHCLSFFFWPLYCLSFFDLWLQITALVSSNFFKYIPLDGFYLNVKKYSYNATKYEVILSVMKRIIFLVLFISHHFEIIWEKIVKFMNNLDLYYFNVSWPPF